MSRWTREERSKGCSEESEEGGGDGDLSRGGGAI